MADFSQAHAFVEKWEGFWSNDPNDPGGETLYGIARNRHPNWDGWAVWDKHKVEKERDLPHEVKHELRQWRDFFYRTQFWHPLRCQFYPTRRLAIIVYQAAVNCGMRRVARWLQTTVNNVTGAELIVDGRIREKSLRAIQQAFDAGHIRTIEDGVLAKQREHYRSLAHGSPQLATFLNGWMNRVNAAEKL